MFHRLNRFYFRLAVWFLATASPVIAAELGMTAPPLTVSKWLRGGPINLPATNASPHILVFIETGCGACKDSIPTLNRLQEKHRDKGLAIVAVSWENPPVIEQFVNAMGGQINFAVAADDAFKTYNNYMRAFGETISPHAFLIDQSGKIVWHRHPLWGLEQAVENLLSGNFDLAAEKRAERARELQKEYFTLARAEKADPRTAGLGREIVQSGAANPWLLNDFAWTLLTDSTLKTRDLELATRAVESAYHSSGKTNPAFADTFALALFESGKTAAAVEMQRRALALCTDPRERPALEQALRRYEEKLKPAAR